jgi:hypothetical protein
MRYVSVDVASPTPYAQRQCTASRSNRRVWLRASVCIGSTRTPRRTDNEQPTPPQVEIGAVSYDARSGTTGVEEQGLTIFGVLSLLYTRTVNGRRLGRDWRSRRSDPQ